MLFVIDAFLLKQFSSIDSFPKVSKYQSTFRNKSLGKNSFRARTKMVVDFISLFREMNMFVEIVDQVCLK